VFIPTVIWVRWCCSPPSACWPTLRGAISSTKKINEEIARLDPERQEGRRAGSPDQPVARAFAAVDDFHKHTRNDLDAVHELTRLIEPPAWTKHDDITRDSFARRGSGRRLAAG